MQSEVYHINYNDRFATYELNRKLSHLINNINKNFNKIVFVCIGSDRATGDCYGPLVGHMLSRYKLYEFGLFGTLEEPVHAGNLIDVLDRINTDDTLVIGIDSCLGRAESIGYISVGYGGIKPGSGVGKNLPVVGDIHIAGIVNIAGLIPNIVLQCTSLKIVYKMAEITSSAIRHSLYKREKSIELKNKSTISV